MAPHSLDSLLGLMAYASGAAVNPQKVCTCLSGAAGWDVDYILLSPTERGYVPHSSTPMGTPCLHCTGMMYFI